MYFALTLTPFSVNIREHYQIWYEHVQVGKTIFGRVVRVFQKFDVSTAALYAEIKRRHMGEDEQERKFSKVNSAFCAPLKERLSVNIKYSKLVWIYFITSLSVRRSSLLQTFTTTFDRGVPGKRLQISFEKLLHSPSKLPYIPFQHYTPRSSV